jgi:flagellar biosynthetic protein FliQ
MTVDFIAALGRDAVTTGLMVAAPLLGAGLALGLVIGVLQAVTSVQEQTLSFIPKVVGVMVVFLLAMPWMLRLLTSYTANLYMHLARFGGS